MSPPARVCKSSLSVNFDGPAIAGSYEYPYLTQASGLRTNVVMYAHWHACELPRHSSHHETPFAQSSPRYASAPSGQPLPMGAAQRTERRTARTRKMRQTDIFWPARLAWVPSPRHGTYLACAALPPVVNADAVAHSSAEEAGLYDPFRLCHLRY